MKRWGCDGDAPAVTPLSRGCHTPVTLVGQTHMQRLARPAPQDIVGGNGR